MADEFTIQKPKVSVSQTLLNINRKFVITKKIAKHGNQSIIVIPRILEDKIEPGMIAEITIRMIEK